MRGANVIPRLNVVPRLNGMASPCRISSPLPLRERVRVRGANVIPRLNVVPRLNGMASPCRTRGPALEGISPPLRGLASDFGKTQSHQKSSPPANRPLRGFPRLVQRVGAERRRRHFGLRHPWLRPKPASNILVLAPNRGRAVLALIRFGPYVGCGCAIIPDGAPDPLNSTRRFTGGTNTVPARGFIFLVDRLLLHRRTAIQGLVR